MKHFIKASALFVALVMTIGLSAQDIQKTMTVEELKAEKASLNAKIAELQGQVAGIEKKIFAYPGWKFGGTGIVGFKWGQFDNWYPSETPITESNSFSVNLNGFANLDEEKFFWRNRAEWNAGRSKIEQDFIDENGELVNDDVTANTDLFTLKSLYGYKLNDKWAISAQGIYTTTILDNFNNPGNLIAGAGATWTPIPNFVAVIHPLAYNFAFSKNELAYESSAGANITVDYNAKIANRINWQTQFLSFLSYEDGDYSWWNWTNGITFNAFKGIGVGFNFGLRGNKQEALNYFRRDPNNSELLLENVDSDVQFFYTLGLSYTL